MLVGVFFNDAAGGSFAPDSPNGGGSRDRAEAAEIARMAGERVYLPMMDGYRRSEAVLVESMLSPLIFQESDPLAACERAFAMLNSDFRAEGPVEIQGREGSEAR